MSRGRWFAAAIAGLAVVASFAASASPDGLNRVAADLGFEGREVMLFHAPFADYALPGLPNGVAGAAAALLGAGAVGAVSWGFGRLLARRTPV